MLQPLYLDLPRRHATILWVHTSSCTYSACFTPYSTGTSWAGPWHDALQGCASLKLDLAGISRLAQGRHEQYSRKNWHEEHCDQVRGLNGYLQTGPKAHTFSPIMSYGRMCDGRSKQWEQMTPTVRSTCRLDALALIRYSPIALHVLSSPGTWFGPRSFMLDISRFEFNENQVWFSSFVIFDCLASYQRANSEV